MAHQTVMSSLFELGGRRWLLTTDHPASSCDLPVLVEANRFGHAIGNPIGAKDEIELPAQLPPRSLGLEIEACPEGPTRAYSGAEIAGYSPHPATRDGYLNQCPTGRSHVTSLYEFMSRRNALFLEWLNMQLGGDLPVWYRHTEESYLERAAQTPI